MTKKLTATQKINAITQVDKVSNKNNFNGSAKIKQKITKIVKKDSIVYAHIVNNMAVFDFHNEIYGEEKKGMVPFLIYSDDVTSPHYWKYLSNTGMLDFSNGVETSFQGVARRENTISGVKPVYVDANVIVNDVEISAELGGHSTTFAYLIKDTLYYALMSAEASYSAPVHIFDELKVAYSSVSQTRKGDLVFVSYKEDRLKVLEKLNFELKAFMQNVKGRVYFNSVKAFSRVKLSNSSAKAVDLFKGYELYDEETKTYSGAPDEDGVLSTVESKVFILKNEDKEFRIETMPQDFEVELEQDVVSPEFSSTEKGAKIVKKTRTLTRPATDGAIYVDAQTVKSMNFQTSSQFRFTPVGKGMIIVVPGLLKLTGSHMIMFAGAIKGDIGVYFRKNQFDFYVLNETRKAQKEGGLLLSRQVFCALTLDNYKTLDLLVGETKDILKRAYEFEEEALSEFIGIKEAKEEGSDNEEDALDIDNLTVEMFSQGKSSFLKSSAHRKAAASLVKASTLNIENGGKLWLNGAQMLHMTVDPLMVMSYLSEGKLWVKAFEEKQRGIRAKQVIASVLNGNKYAVEHKKAYLARYPFLHRLEGQLVNSDGGSAYNDYMAYEYYKKTIESGYFQGLAIYSLWDMVPEGQSGADFDGDQTLYITNPIVTDNVSESVLFLDYSILDGELVEGVPWKTNKNAPTLEQAVGRDVAEKLRAKGVNYDKGVFDFDASLVDDIELQRALADSMANIAAISNDESNIGKFTNINASIMEIEAILNSLIRKIDACESTTDLKLARQQIEEEVKGYKKLSFLMACAIRWEIDKAKHGGDFMEKLGFLQLMISGTQDMKDVWAFEEEFDISLERLFRGKVSKDKVTDALLGEVGKMPVLYPDKSNKIKKPLISSSIDRGKGFISGAEYTDSPYLEISDTLTELSEGFTNQIVNESNSSFTIEALKFIEYVESGDEEAGLEPFSLDLPSFSKSKRKILAGHAPTNATEIVASYREKMHLANKPINDMTSSLLKEYEAQIGKELVNKNKYGIEWLLKKTFASKAEADEGAKLLAAKELVVAKHKGLGEAMLPQEHPLAKAYIYAKLYVMNVRAEEESRKRRQEEAQRVLRNQLIEKFDAPLSEASVAKIKAYVLSLPETHSEGGYSSIQSLFPLGAVQFLQFLESGIVRTKRQVGQNVAAWFAAPNGLSEQERASWMALESTVVTVELGVLNGLVVAEEDTLMMESKRKSPSLRQVAHRNKLAQEILMKTKYDRGARVWFGGKQRGFVSNVTVYKSGVAVYFEGMTSI